VWQAWEGVSGAGHRVEHKEAFTPTSVLEDLGTTHTHTTLCHTPTPTLAHAHAQRQRSTSPYPLTACLVSVCPSV
jgi:hypothetical protein